MGDPTTNSAIVTGVGIVASTFAANMIYKYVAAARAAAKQKAIDDAPGISKRVLVVGGGPCGCVALKEMREAGHVAIAVEKTDRIGGVFADDDKAPSYDNLYLTTSNYFMCYGDFPPKKGDPMRYWTKREYIEYLFDYVKHFGLMEHIELSTTVLKAKKVDGVWNVTTVKDGVQQTRLFDAITVATGSNHVPNIPVTAAGFKGETMHSSQYRNPEQFRGKKVLVVGFGESAADIGPEIASVAKECTCWGRRCNPIAPRFPTLATKHYNHDEFALLQDPKASRECQMQDFLEYMSTPRMYNELSVGFIGLNQQVYFQALMADKSCSPLAWLSGRIMQNASRFTWATWFQGGQSFWVTKNGRPLKSWADGSLGLIWSKTAEFGPNSVVFPACERIGMKEYLDKPVRHELEIDTIVYCTGYKTQFDWLEIPGVEINPRTWFKHSIPPGFEDGSLAFIGWSRGQQGGIPQLAEMLVRYHALLVAGKRTLPANYAEIAKQEGDQETKYYHYSPGLKALVDYPAFMDTVAQLIGCKPDVPTWYLRPYYFFQYWSYPMWSYWFRTKGPGAKPEVLKEVLERFPIYSKGLFPTKGTGTPLFGLFGYLIAFAVSLPIQKAINVGTMLFAPRSCRTGRTGKNGGFLHSWLWAIPKQNVLHNNKMTWESAIIAS